MEKDLPLNIQKAVRRYKPIQVSGLTLYPVRVKEEELFRLSIPALETLQQTFPVRLMSMPILQAMYQLDYEAAMKGEPLTGLFTCALLGLALSLRLGEELDADGKLKQFRIAADAKDPSRLKKVSAMLNGEEIIEITPAQYAKIRPIIAAQNGIRLYGDDANPDLVEAEKVMASQGPQLKGSIEDEIDFVQLLETDADVDEWAILKLHNKADAMRKVLDYVICSINAGNGCTWKGGNPCPHPWLEREQETSSHVSMQDFANGEGIRAMEAAGQEIN